MDEKDLLAIRNLGRKSVEEIRERLIARGYLPQVQVPGVILEEAGEVEETVEAILKEEAVEEEPGEVLAGRPFLREEVAEEEPGEMLPGRPFLLEEEGEETTDVEEEEE